MSVSYAWSYSITKSTESVSSTADIPSVSHVLTCKSGLDSVLTVENLFINIPKSMSI